MFANLGENNCPSNKGLSKNRGYTGRLAGKNVFCHAIFFKNSIRRKGGIWYVAYGMKLK
jgi:hypothetical protein